MTALRHPTSRVGIAAISRGAARTRTQRLILDRGHLHHRSISASATSKITTLTHAEVTLAEGSKKIGRNPTLIPRDGLSQRPKLAVRRQLQPNTLKALQGVPFDRLMRLIAPQSSSEIRHEARNLEEVQFETSAWSAAVLPKTEFAAILKQYLDIRNVDVQTFLSYRNAMLAKSWPDARRYMVSIPDHTWPPFVLQRTINTVSTPSEVSDALAILDSNVFRARHLVEAGDTSLFKVLRSGFVVLSRLTVKKSGSTLHLIPRLTDLLLALFEKFPAQMASSPELVYDFTRRCTGIPDQRSRQAITRVVDWLALRQETDKFDIIRDRVVEACIRSIEHSMRLSPGQTSSSAHFAHVELMQRLLRHHPANNAELRSRTLRCAIFAAGLDGNYARTWEWFDEYEHLKRSNGAEMTGSDYQLLAKALVRSREGRRDAWRVYLQGERLWRTQLVEMTRDRSQKRTRTQIDEVLAGNCIDLLEVMAKSDDVPVGEILSMLGIFLKGGDAFTKSRSFVEGDRLSRAMLQRRADPYAYSIVMHGLLIRERSKCALTVWNAMLQRGVMPNAANLSLLLQNLFHLKDVKKAMQQLHLWCEQGLPTTAHQCDKLKAIEVPNFSTTELVDVDMLLPAGTPTPTDQTRRYRVEPDPILATVVFSGLHSCGSQGIGSLWEVYQQTIKRFPDAPVLAMLLKASCTDEASSNVDAQRGRQVFRDMLHRKHPELAEHRNTLREVLGAQGATGWIFSNDSMGARMEGWLTSVFQSPNAEAVDESSAAAEEANLDALVFTPELFEHYLRLLLHLEHSSDSEAKARSIRHEIVDTLSYMRYLHVTPTQTHLALTVLDIEENFPPAVATQQMDALDAWIVDWLGERGMPTEEVMQRHWSWKTRRNGQRKGWFEPVRASQSAWSEQGVAAKQEPLGGNSTSSSEETWM
ncbi:NAD-dependent histone deacetylase [Pseudozyma hubeiensis SY62]|uniref:NAD-dependent histone deacetylase n=1 Tax=Pseudozyma hubeiensis (strain SY62) TaxID=1305764 RepID=R9P4X3_PSEHS|nr:NAD-dependent histone deacetylase [Pseudozyma hubeiensis SY62]GAC93165.1 NAD-dependent histone deacetylase [Pseudozyma hubeiensis SY62]